jgi:outer membrane protein assembly factor BamD (BamD/ComL family)
VTKATKADRSGRVGSAGPGLGGMAVWAVLLATLPGCTSLPTFHLPWKQDDKAAANDGVKDGAKEAFVLRGNGLEKSADWHPRQAELRDAKRLIDEKKFEEGEKAFHAISNDKKCPEQFREEALFFEGECQRLQKHYRAAEETYAQLFKDYPSTQFTERADRAMFEIALHWLEGTRQQMEAYEEQRDGKRWMVMPTTFIHFSSDMPVFDPEGHAVRVLEGIQMREKVMHTALGEQALMYLATIRFYREDYLEADRHFTDLYQNYPNSKNAARAIKQSVICKQLCTGGTIYDLRTVEESRKLIHTAQTAYPEFSRETEWIQKQLVGINLQQADRDWRVAEFYRWTSHPGAAYFYYELVRRCYPRTEYASKAEARIRELEQRHPDAVRPAQLPSTEPAATLSPPSPSGQTPPASLPEAAPNGAPPRTLPPSVAPRS